MSPPSEKYHYETTPAGPKEVLYEMGLYSESEPDHLVTAPQFCDVHGNCVYAIYHRDKNHPDVRIRGKDCALYLGLTWGTRRFMRLDSWHGGYYDFVAETVHAGNYALVRYQFNGTEYVGVDQEICRRSRQGSIQCAERTRLGGVPLPVERWDQPGLWPFEYAEQSHSED